MRIKCYLIMLFLAVISLLCPAVVLADQQEVDNDIASTGLQNIITLAGAPGATVNVSGQIIVTRSGGNHLTPGSALNFVVTPSQTTLPLGYSVSSVSGTTPGTWATDPNGTVYVAGSSSISFTAPATTGSYS